MHCALIQTLLTAIFIVLPDAFPNLQLTQELHNETLLQRGDNLLRDILVHSKQMKVG